MLIDNNSLFVIPDGIGSCWASPENPKAEKGKAASTGGGRKGSPCFPLKVGEHYVLAEQSGCSGTIRRIWVTISDRSAEMLRGLKLDFSSSGGTEPFGGFERSDDWSSCTYFYLDRTENGLPDIDLAEKRIR
jgi:hypothetical protein